METHLKRFVDLYTKAIKENNAAIFAGAGLSIPAGFVNWKNLLRDIASDLNLDIDKENDLIAIAQYHYNESGNNRHKLNQLLIEEFTQGARITPNHKILSSLPIQTYWTTNYDKLIEKALEEAGKTPDVKINHNNLSNNIPKRDAVVYKMHGDVSQPDQAILTKDDYQGYNEKRPLFTTALQGDLVAKTFLFIGFSFDDPNLEYILGRIRILLGQNQRDHYCFFKKVNRNDYNTDADFNYAQIQHQLKIKDLKRYSINALLVDDYSEITETLSAIQKKVLRSNIFISGAAKIYDPRTEEEVFSFVHKLSFTIASKGYKIVSGVGHGIGRVVITGALDYLFSTNYRHLDNALVLRPFPLALAGEKSKEDRNLEYRKEMMQHAGIALFIYGNKDNGKGGWENSNGMIEEFEIAIQQRVIPLPVGATAYAAEVLWHRVMSSPSTYYPNNSELLTAVERMGNKTIGEDELINQIIKAVGILQNLY
ncbi:SIR2 family protein [Flavihumibacter sp. UBA7668]|uniref:SIR2 family protein n=1 Tax=Flavihumibacter sp. UBA7668 TaxID=1946542 RepID=UPI0025C42641|nr:SIR2 family protein [Flavihumibacter sp. UBA7668]